eukprot:TRINITY_DN15186_c1_g1_i3.p1 TRINITY_DN15186_c1_g1~~TRINITY_DN15186_c1_g1_i3.p1  ORF type:complete len:492 (-),score=78.85 TRINITY_DN15186_c1_g1_i3:639-2114(-)
MKLGVIFQFFVMLAFPHFILGAVFSGSFAGGGLPGFDATNLPTIDLIEPEVEENFEGGETSANVIIERVISYPETGSTDLVTLRNNGGKVADLTGWTLSDDKQDPFLTFGEPGCEGNASVLPQESLEILPASDANPCGFPFGVSFRDSVILRDERGNVVGNATWQTSEKGSSIRRIENGYVMLPEYSHLMDILRMLPEFSIFVQILEATGTDRILDNDANPNYKGPKLPSPPSPDYQIEFPWWFGFATDRTQFPPSPPPPPPPPSPPVGQVPPLGPYTIFAPTNAAFEDLLLLLGGGRVRVPIQAFLKLPELVEIIQYHIAYGSYSTNYMFNNTGIQSTLGPEVVVMKDARWTEGYIALSDSCVDKPTTGYPCDMQFEFDKCYEPFMISPLAAGWQGGFCQKTCQRCTCDDKAGGTCAKVYYPDIFAANGVIHGISRVMFPPPMFSDVEEEELLAPTPDGIGDIASDNSLLGLPIIDGTQLPRLPNLPSLS